MKPSSDSFAPPPEGENPNSCELEWSVDLIENINPLTQVRVNSRYLKCSEAKEKKMTFNVTGEIRRNRDITVSSLFEDSVVLPEISSVIWR